MGFLLVVLLLADPLPAERIRALEFSLNAAIANDAPIVLKAGDDFEAPPGTVILISREEGIARLIAMARAGEEDLQMFYLPRWGAWITETTERGLTTSSDISFCTAAMMSETDIELWHFHNNVGDPAPLTAQEATLVWAMPSATDFGELYGWGDLRPTAKFRAFVASPLGVTEYRSDEYTNVGPRRFLWPLLVSEGNLINTKAKEAGHDGLQAMAAAHRGIFSLTFEPVP